MSTRAMTPADDGAAWERGKLSRRKLCRAPRQWHAALLVVAGSLLIFAHDAAADEVQPLIERLDDRTRGKVILALAGLILLAFLLMGITWLAFRVVRRRIREARQIVERQRGRSSEDDEWARKPLS